MPWEIFRVPDLGQKRHKAANEVLSKACQRKLSGFSLEAFRLLTGSILN